MTDATFFRDEETVFAASNKDIPRFLGERFNRSPGEIMKIVLVFAGSGTKYPDLKSEFHFKRVEELCEIPSDKARQIIEAWMIQRAAFPKMAEQGELV